MDAHTVTHNWDLRGLIATKIKWSRHVELIATDPAAGPEPVLRLAIGTESLPELKQIVEALEEIELEKIREAEGGLLREDAEVAPW